jgi:hypothetical protein
MAAAGSAAQRWCKPATKTTHEEQQVLDTRQEELCVEMQVVERVSLQETAPCSRMTGVKPAEGSILVHYA